MPNKENLTDSQRNNVASWLIINSSNGKLRYGAKQEASKLFHISLKTVWRIWKAAAAQKALGQPIHIKNMKKGGIHKDKWQLDEENVINLSTLKRGSIRKFAPHLNVSIALLHHWIKKEKKLQPHTNAIKPLLTPKNMLARLKWCLSKLSCISSNGRISFQSMYEIIHIDEKWFNLTQTTQRYYKLPDEKGTYRSIQSKQHIDKIMFLCAIGRPIYNNNGDCTFDGKYGIFPFIYKEPAARNSKNRPKGTMITKPIQAITKAEMKKIFLAELVPCIKEKCPEEHRMHIIIQQDNARPHINNDDPDFQAAAQTDGFHMQLVCQPANSPDTNVLDLGFFRSIQSLKDEKAASNVVELIKNVEEAYENYPVEKIIDVFYSLQNCMKEIIKVKGSNDYKLPHAGKERLRRLGILPENVMVEEQLVRESMDYLQQEENEPGVLYTLESIVDGMNHVFLAE